MIDPKNPSTWPIVHIDEEDVAAIRNAAFFVDAARLKTPICLPRFIGLANEAMVLYCLRHPCEMTLDEVLDEKDAKIASLREKWRKAENNFLELQSKFEVISKKNGEIEGLEKGIARLKAKNEKLVEEMKVQDVLLAKNDRDVKHFQAQFDNAQLEIMNMKNRMEELKKQLIRAADRLCQT